MLCLNIERVLKEKVDLPCRGRNGPRYYFRYILEYGAKIFVHIKLYIKFARSNEVMAHGVIGNTAGFGPVVLGSSPSGPTRKTPDFIEVGGFGFLGGAAVKRDQSQLGSSQELVGFWRIWATIFEGLNRLLYF